MIMTVMMTASAASSPMPVSEGGSLRLHEGFHGRRSKRCGEDVGLSRLQHALSQLVLKKLPVLVVLDMITVMMMMTVAVSAGTLAARPCD